MTVLTPDVNVLIGAHRADAVTHEQCAAWLRWVVRDGPQLALIDSVLHGFVRVISNPKIYRSPVPLDLALTFVDRLLEHPEVVRISAGPRHWDLFSDLCRGADARGNLVSDAAHAAVAIEHGATLVSLDRDFAKFPGLRWELPKIG